MLSVVCVIQDRIGWIKNLTGHQDDSGNRRTHATSHCQIPMKSESKRILLAIQRKAINPITDKPMFRTSDEVLEEALEVFHQHLRGKKVILAV